MFKEKLGLKDTFSYKTIEGAYENPLVTPILGEIFRMSQEPIDKEHIFSSDGTGLPTSMKQTGRMTVERIRVRGMRRR